MRVWFAQVNLGAGFVLILCLGKHEKSCCKLLGDFRGLVCEESMACTNHGLRAVWLEFLPLENV